MKVKGRGFFGLALLAILNPVFLRAFFVILKCLIVFFGALAFGVEPDWSSATELSLSKDEKRSGEVVVYGVSKPLSLHWTLNKVKNNKSMGIVVLLNFDGFNHHFVLFKDVNRDTFTLKLGSRNDYLVLILKDYEENSATFFLGAHGEVGLSL